MLYSCISLTCSAYHELTCATLSLDVDAHNSPISTVHSLIIVETVIPCLQLPFCSNSHSLQKRSDLIIIVKITKSFVDCWYSRSQVMSLYPTWLDNTTKYAESFVPFASQKNNFLFGGWFCMRHRCFLYVQFFQRPFFLQN